MLFWLYADKPGGESGSEFSRLYESINEDLKNFVARMMNYDTYSADEIIQETYMTALENSARYGT